MRRNKTKNLFGHENVGFDGPDDETRDHPRPLDNRCTPEKLVSLCRSALIQHGRFPTLLEIKNEFGGMLGAYVDAWEIEEGVWEELLSMKISFDRGGCATENP